MTSTELKTLRALKWVDKVGTYAGRPKIVTKAGSLKVQLTHYAYSKKLLPEPVVIPLPQYEIVLRAGSFLCRLHSMPDSPNHEKVGDLLIIRYVPSDSTKKVFANFKGGIKDFNSPCLGSYEELYDKCTNYIERASVVSEYLQAASPDTRGYPGKTLVMYQLGLIGEEFLKPATNK